MEKSRQEEVEFDEKSHRYFFRGKELYGITGAIGAILGKSFPDSDLVRSRAVFGSDVHKDVERHYNEGLESSRLSSNAARWVVEAVDAFCKERCSLEDKPFVSSEVMVSDYETTASKVDVVVRSVEGKAWLFDIKTTSRFDREYCTRQLNAYKILYEMRFPLKVEGLYVLATEARRMYKIAFRDAKETEAVLEMNRKKAGISAKALDKEKQA